MKADNTLGKHLNTMLSWNTGFLLTLIFRKCKIDYQCGALVAQGLENNTTLVCLDVSESKMNFDAVRALCAALEKNKTCILKIGEFAHWPTLRDTSDTVATYN